MPVATFPAIAYLLLGTSVWNPAIRVLQPLSQILSARIATGLLQVLGIPAFWSSRMEGGAFQRHALSQCVNAAGAQSSPGHRGPGASKLLRAATRLPSTFRFGRPFGGRVVILVTGVRIALVGLLAYRGLGNGDLQGTDVFEGVVVSAFGYLVIFACIPVLSRIGRRRQPDGRVPEPTGAGLCRRPPRADAPSLSNS